MPGYLQAWLACRRVVKSCVEARRAMHHVRETFPPRLLTHMAPSPPLDPGCPLQTGTGWVLRELGKGDSPCMLQVCGAF